MKNPIRFTRTARPGYTLIELLMSFALVAIVVGFAYPRLDWARFEADSGARQVRVALQGAQRLAVTQQSTVIVGVDSAQGRMRVLEDINGNLQADAGERITWRTLDNGLAFLQPPTAVPAVTGAGAVVNLAGDIIDGYPSLIFRRDGSASANAALYVRAMRHNDTHWRAVTVTKSTGRVDWYTTHAYRATASSTLSWKRANL
jgi:prepilin-type N-terminal cleavage/methylation domain-containing protein